MTVSTGTPDWQAVTQQHNQVLCDNLAQSYAPGSNTLYSGAAANMSSLQIRVTCGGGYGKLKVSWYSDSGMTRLYGADEWMINTAAGLLCSYPVQAPFCVIEFDTTSAGDATISAYIIGTQIPSTRIEYLVTSQTIYVYDHTIDAGATENYYPEFLIRGNASLILESNDSSAVVETTVYMTDESGAATGYIMDALPLTDYFTAQFQIPDQPVMVELVNTDASNPHNVTVCLVIAG
jgi:hypothetical protein